jgi:arylsulfatase A-like enzyme
MYGIRPSTSCVYMNAPKPWTVSHLEDKSTLPRWFAKHGYHTLTTGKIYHGSGLPPGDFDVVGPRPGQRFKTDPRLVKMPGSGNLWDYGPQEYAEEKFQDHIDATWTIEQLGKEYQQPFMMAVGFYRPHVPFYAPSRIFRDHPIEQTQLPPTKANDLDDIPETAKKVTAKKPPLNHIWFEENHEWKPAVQAYLACIQWTDGSEELYDLQKDPNEWDNLAAGKRKSKTQKLIDELAQHLPTTNAVGAKAKPKKQ